MQKKEMEKDLYSVLIDLLENGPAQGRLERLIQLLGDAQTLSNSDQVRLLTRTFTLLRLNKTALEFFQSLKKRSYFAGNLLTNYKVSLQHLISIAVDISRKYKERKHIKLQSERFVQTYKFVIQNLKDFYQIQNKLLKDQVGYHSGYVSRVTGVEESFSRIFYYFIAYNITSVSRLFRIKLTPDQVRLLIQSNHLAPFNELAVQKKPTNISEFFTDSELTEWDMPIGNGLLDPDQNNAFFDTILRDNAEKHLQEITNDLILEYYLKVGKGFNDVNQMLKCLVISRNIYYSREKFRLLRSEIDTLIDEAISDLNKEADSISHHHLAITNLAHPYWSQIELHYDVEHCIRLMKFQQRRFALFLSEYSARNRHFYGIRYARDDYKFTNPKHERIYRLALLAEYLGIGSFNIYYTALTSENAVRFSVSDQINTDPHHLTVMTTFILNSQAEPNKEAKAFFTFFSGFVNSYYLRNESKFGAWNNCHYDSTSVNNICTNDDNTKNMRSSLEYIRGRDHSELVEFNEIFANPSDIGPVENRIREVLGFHKKEITRYVASKIRPNLSELDRRLNLFSFFMQLIFHEELDSNSEISDAIEGLLDCPINESLLDVQLQREVLNHINVISRFFQNEESSSENYPRINNTELLFEMMRLDYNLHKFASIEAAPQVQRDCSLLLGEMHVVNNNRSIEIVSQTTHYASLPQASTSSRLEPLLIGLLSVIYRCSQFLIFFPEPKPLSETLSEKDNNFDLNGNPIPSDSIAPKTFNERGFFQHNHTKKITLWIDQDPTPHHSTFELIWNIRIEIVYDQNISKNGTAALYGTPLLCRSEDGLLTNLIQPTGLFVDFLERFNRSALPDICKTLAPTPNDILFQSIKSGAFLGSFRAIGAVTEKSLNNTRSKLFAFYAGKTLTYGLNFAYVLSSHPEFMYDWTQPAIEATTSTVNLIAIDAAFSAGSKLLNWVSNKTSHLPRVSALTGFFGRNLSIGAIPYQIYQQGVSNVMGYIGASMLTKEIITHIAGGQTYSWGSIRASSK